MTRTRKFTTTAAVLALVAAAGATVAVTQGALAHGRDGMMRGDRGAKMEQRFGEMDADKDGKVTAAEMRAARQARFAKADADGDGKLSVEEMDAARKAKRLERLNRMVLWLDADGDGMLSVEEFDTRKGHMLSRMDEDGDGALSMEEMREAGKRFHQRHGSGHHGGQMGGQMGGPQTDGQKN